jgi:RNA polymerase sigma-70 factor (ECF subfamily)
VLRRKPTLGDVERVMEAVRSRMTGAGKRWDVTTGRGFMSYYDATFDDAYRTAARLAGGRRHVAEDLVQDAYLRLFDVAQRDAVTEVGVGWIITTVRRRFLDRARSAERESRRVRLVTAANATASEPEEASTSGVLGHLIDRERAALVLRYVDNLSVAEVAELLGTSVRATESLLQRAKRKAQESNR